MAKKSYVSLHTHTEMSLLDGYGRISGFVAEGKRQGMPAMAITDHGHLCGLPQFYRACREADIEPILGEEFYFTTDLKLHQERMKDRRKEPKGDAGYVDSEDDGYGRYHFVALAIGHRGYQVLSELSTEAFRNFYHKPLLDRSSIEGMSEKDREHLVILSGCAASVISKAVLARDDERARENTLWWREMFPNFFMEFQHHDTSFDRALNKGLKKLASRYGIPHVVTNDPHYVLKEDCDYHDALLAIQTASDIDDPNRFRFDGTGYHLRTLKEMDKAFRGYKGIFQEGISNTLEVAKMCHTRIPEWEKRSWHIPRFPDVKKSKKFLRKLVKDGLKSKGLWDKAEYRARAEHELAVISDVQIEDFLLITWDVIAEARERRLDEMGRGIPVGPGRGSVCGCLVAYALGIHKIDPIRYNLLFERFLNPARPKMPDVDTDFGQRRRSEMFDYVEEKYGKDNVVKVCTYARMRMRAAFQSLASAYGISFQERIRISTQMGDSDDVEEVLPPEIKRHYPGLAERLKHLEGTKRAFATHPAGVIIADPRDRIGELVPEMVLVSGNEKKWVGQYDLEAVEDMGLMKQDFLGLRTLDTIEECLRQIYRETGEWLDPDSWIPDEEPGDSKVWAMLARGETEGVFQMEGPVNRRGCLEVQPKEFEDVVSITSLYRTGPIDAGYPDIFNANRKLGKKKKIKYATPLLKPILEETWGVILYQEQVMRIGEELAGFDQVQVDDIKEAIKHKKSALMKSMKPLFVKGCKKHSNIPQEVAEKIWQDIEGYSGYSYNRSHAVAYTFTTYQTARLRRFYFLEFYAGLLRTAPTGSKAAKAKKEGYLRTVAREGYKILPPDINKSDAYFTSDRKAGAVRFGLQDIKGVGPKVVERLLAARGEGFGTVTEVEEAVRNTGVFAALCDSGALLSLGVKPGSPIRVQELLSWDFHDGLSKLRKKFKKQVRLPQEGQEGEVCILGEITRIVKRETKTGKPYVTWTLKHSPTELFQVRLWSETSKLWRLREGSVVLVTGKWEPRWENCSISSRDGVEIISEV